MKKILIIAIAFVFLINCQSKIEDNSFRISGKIDVNSGKVVLKTKTFSDTTDISNGKFIFKGELEEPARCKLSIIGKTESKTFYLENSDILITGKSLEAVVVTGSKMEDEKLDYNRKLKQVEIEFDSEAIDEEWDNASSEKRKELDEIYNAYDKQVIEAKRQFVIDNPTSYYSTLILWDIDWIFNSAQDFFEFIKPLDSSLDHFSNYEQIKATFHQLEKFEDGKIAPDITLIDADNNSVKLSDQYKKSKYLIINTWASTCSPCRKENKNLAKLYEKYHDQGLNILSISTDTSPELWKKTIELDNMTWTNVCNFKEWNDNELVEHFAVRQQSENKILNSEGKLVASNVKGQELEELLEILF